MTKICGKAWKFGDNIDTDIIIPACHLVLPLEEMKAYAMAPIAPDFAAKAADGDVIIAGKNFGCGSSREQAPAVLKALGIKAVVAKSFARIFFRNAINLGVPAIACDQIQENIQESDRIEIDLVAAQIFATRRSMRFSCSKLPDFLMDIMTAGGLIPFLAAQKRNPKPLLLNLNNCHR
jgi:3-isopropylmalate/(R)-2-methylmalate dehydratase small subunit